MDNTNNVQIKVENEAQNEYEEESYEEYTINYINCKEEDISDYAITTAEPHAHARHRNQEQLDKNAGDSNTKEKQVNVNCHDKKTIVTHFLDNGWTSKSYKDLCKKVSPEKVEEYGKTINKAIEDGQHFVYQECESLCFGNITDWLEVFKTMNVKENSYFEPAIIMNAIVNNEHHPEPKQIGGINLKQVYSFLCNGLMGIPQQPMDPVTAKFLATEFESLINDANSDIADSHTLLMKQKLERCLVEKKGQVPPSLDPLWLTEGTIVHNDILKDAHKVTIVQQDILVPKNETTAITYNGGMFNQNNTQDIKFAYDVNLNQNTEDTKVAYNGNLDQTNEDTTIACNGMLNPKTELTQ